MNRNFTIKREGGAVSLTLPGVGRFAGELSAGGGLALELAPTSANARGYVLDGWSTDKAKAPRRRAEIAEAVRLHLATDGLIVSVTCPVPV